MSSSNTSDRFQTFIAVGIALATVIGAVLAARATLLNDDANDFDQAGLSSAIDLALARSNIEIQRAQNLIAFLDFSQERRSAQLIAQEMDQLDLNDPARLQLSEQAAADWNKAINSRYFFNTDYYDKTTDTFDQQTFVDSQLAEAASYQDLAPDPHFDAAQDNRAKASKFVAAIVALAIALFSLAVAEVLHSRFRYTLAGLGTLVLIGSVAASLLIEIGVL